MATQNEGFTPVNFSITSPFTNFKIIEVSEDIASLIEDVRKGESKTNPVLQFKSAPRLETGAASSSARGTSSGKEKDSILHLCSENQVWAIKQVSTSNSVYLIRPLATATNNGPVEDHEAKSIQSSPSNHADDMDITTALTNATRGSVTAVSQVRNFLELHAVKPTIPDIPRAIMELVPIWNSLGAEEDDALSMYQAQQDRKPALSTKQLTGSIAAPDIQIKQACAKLCIYEDDQQRSHLPSPTALLDVWSKAIQGCAIELIKLDHALNEERIRDTLENPIDQCIAKQLFKEGGTMEALELIQSTLGDIDASTSASSTLPSSQQGLRYLKPQETSVLVAKLILRARAYRYVILESDTGEAEASAVAAAAVGTVSSSPTGGIEVQEFIKQWADLVPSSFVKYCTVETLRTSHGLSSSIEVGADGKEVLRWKASYEDLVLGNDIVDKSGGSIGKSVGENGGTAAATTTASKSAANTKRKWHEKFGAQRIAKR